MATYLNDKANPIKKLEELKKENDKMSFFFICEKCGNVAEKIYHQYYKNMNLICKSCSHKNNKGYIIMKQKMLEKYGTTSTSQFIDYSKIDYNKRYEKSKQTFIEKYGVDNPAKSEDVKNKIKNTNVERYGFSVAAKNENVKDKQRKTIKERYGNNMPGPRASHIKFLNQRLQELNESNITWLDKDSFRGKYDNGPIYYNFRCNECGNLFKDDFHSGFPICKKCNPSLNGHSKTEIEIQDFVKSICNYDVICNDRSVLDGKELDIYIPSKKVAIEYNGTYWHGYRNDETRSLNKFKKDVEYKRVECQKKGIRLINVDECDYLNRPEVFKRFFVDLICERKRVYARDCTYKEIDTKTAEEFLTYYHVNGFRGGYYKCGLFYNDELICVAVFGKHKKYENECIRLCYKTGYDIVGGWDKIQKHFGKKFLHYVNLKYFSGENKTGCGYRFVINKQLYSRQQLQKAKLIKMFDDYDDSVSDFQNCLKHNGIAIFDCGNDIRIYNQK